MISIKKKLIDLNIFLSITLTLIIIGFIFIYSSSSIYALEKFNSSHYFLKKQFFGLILGFIALCIAWFFPIKAIKKLSPLVFFFNSCTDCINPISIFCYKNSWLKSMDQTFWNYFSTK